MIRLSGICRRRQYSTTSIHIVVSHEADPKFSNAGKLNESRKGEEIFPLNWSRENSRGQNNGISNVNYWNVVWNKFCYVVENLISLDVKKNGWCFHIDISFHQWRYCIVVNKVFKININFNEWNSKNGLCSIRAVVGVPTLKVQ